ncbi:4Fe-4S dicluster domain-containing protein [Thermococcus indicus]|uniref:4Fe-4S dicluster domain-containing protein n=1 Tax=Thermococcus indicus TaxID=2586643 RepID=A0A4Y5SME4_9EURY|nr:4Fe-4S dicluster domain-containing protein [Thermococcus indicus]QDA31241.1 4Fe-4S dicluster domain-containing protein [Thermococcus indicus]
MKKVFIDFRRCIGCGSCEAACAREHNGKPNISIVQTSELMMMSFNCRHCENAPCMLICPARALYRDEDGAVRVKYHECIGCMLCSIACPFGTPRFDERLKVMVKCDLCANRRAEGKLPACVETCPMDALILATEEEIVGMKLKEAAVRREEFIRKVEDMMGCGP